MAPIPTPTPIPRPRNHDPYTQYVRRRRNRYQARPYLGGQRHYLGTFRTHHDARRAVVKFFAGQLVPLPRYVRPVFADGRQCAYASDAEGYVARIRTPLVRFHSRVFPTREEAHAAAVAHLNAVLARARQIVHSPARGLSPPAVRSGHARPHNA